MRQIQWSSIRTGIIIQLFILCAAVSLSYSQSSLQSGDAYVRRQGNEWILGTSRVERRIRLADGQLTMSSLRNKVSGKNTGCHRAPAEITVSGQWSGCEAPRLAMEAARRHISKGARRNAARYRTRIFGVRVTKHYVIYPGTAVIREWLDLGECFRQAGAHQPSGLLHSRVLGSVASDLEFNYLTGGGNYNGSQLLKSEPMSPTFQRTLDSTEARRPRQLQQVSAT